MKISHTEKSIVSASPLSADTDSNLFRCSRQLISALQLCIINTEVSLTDEMSNSHLVAIPLPCKAPSLSVYSVSVADTDTVVVDSNSPDFV